RYISRERSNRHSPIKEIFTAVNTEINEALTANPSRKGDVKWLKSNVRFCAELYLGHLRYGTFGKNNIESCHPFIRENNWITRTLITAGNFNLTNVDTLFRMLIGIGQHPVEYSDTVTILEKIGHFIDEENNTLYKKYRSEGYPREEITKLIAQNIDIGGVLKNACKKWDGGYAICGLLGHGDAFVIRDPAGIRPAYYYKDDEVLVVTSERPPIQTAFNVKYEDINEVPPGHALIIRRNGDFEFSQFTPLLPRKSCSFERIYFSRGSDQDIYRERKMLGRYLVPAVLKAIDYDIKNTVFSFIPNTAETCFIGMREEIYVYSSKAKLEKLRKKKDWNNEELEEIISLQPRFEKVAVKDAKLRTFITDDEQRNDLTAHVYDITYGVVNAGKDSLVVIDDSIVRGTTMRESILRILDRTRPKKIIIVSSAPQIRYPDCYGIDMAKLGNFIAFEAAVALLKDNGMSKILQEVYEAAKEQLKLPMEDMTNCVKRVYEPFTAEQISDKICQLLTPPGINAEVKFIYQTIEDLHLACPNHLGDWYFTGDYPTPGGNKVVNQSFVNYIEGNNNRAY
ncbi:MAG: hypothetical protein WC071_04955, partial [Victivallaceae bacterium]